MREKDKERERHRQMRGKGERGESQVRWKLGNRSRRDEGYRQKLENMEKKRKRKESSMKL